VECWVYFADAGYIIANAGEAYAYCHIYKHKLKYSLITKAPSTTWRRPRSLPLGSPINSLFSYYALGDSSASAAVPVS
jgi:hypothetical protein